MQDLIKINGAEIFQPDSGNLGYSFETTYTSDSTRTQNGEGHFTPLFTVEQLSYKATDVPAKEVAKILQSVALGKKFTLHYYSLFYGGWRDGEFYVGKGQSNFSRLVLNDERVDSLSFNMTGVNPL